MQVTPNESFEALKEALAQYLETQYRLSNDVLRAERAAMLRKPGAIVQVPFVESTPSFRTSRRLAVVEQSLNQLIPKGLTDLMAFGVPVDRNDLYEHQEKALIAAYSAFAPNLLVATGTGSGKTEAFLLPILADILREAASWPRFVGKPAPGTWDDRKGRWLHSRRNETRRAGIRAIVLYPMNALVNDQLSRLRRILAIGASPDWQARNLNGNYIHFGMYTSATPRAGTAEEAWRRTAVAEYLADVGEQWSRLTDKLRETGNWANVATPEMLVRWDMHLAPPDILVTNYSMLEYMLVRPIESGMFDVTRDWLAQTPGARLTLVVDEAHTYTGAKGTEVAHLVRRLKERLGIAAKPTSFRAIATTASVPKGDDQALKHFAGALFGEDAKRFTLVRADPPDPPSTPHNPDDDNLRLWAEFYDEFVLANPVPAINNLAAKLGKPLIAPSESPQQAAYRLLATNSDLGWIRHGTARNATPLDIVSDEAWGQLEDAATREKATAGLLAMGSFARKEDTASSLPLLSMRLHTFFRGISGIWACLDPKCSQVPQQFAQERPVGKLYLEPRPWCDCGARVLELFTCHYCGLAYLTGVPDEEGHSLWPWKDDHLEGVTPSLELFAVERPDLHSKAWVQPSYRSTRTTAPCDENSPHARPTWEVINPVGRENDSGPENHFPKQCPRCCQFRNPQGREVIENLQTKGFQSFAALLEEAFRQQPRSTASKPNYGRKTLIFSDSRSQAAKLAQDLKDNHSYDLFRQVLYRILYQCDACEGRGSYIKKSGVTFAKPGQRSAPQVCSICGGSGTQSKPTFRTYQDLRTRVRLVQEERGIDPTRQRVSRFFTKLAELDTTANDLAGRFFDVFLRREVTDEHFALEPLGLAKWRVPLLMNGHEFQIEDDSEAFPSLTAIESNILFQSTIRLLAAMNVVVAPAPNAPWDWGKAPDGSDLLDSYRKNVVLRGGYDEKLGWRGNKAIGFSFREDYKLGRYIAAIARKLIRIGRLAPDAQKQWCNDIFDGLWEALVNMEVLVPAGPKVTRYTKEQVPYAIRLDRFQLHPVADIVHRCSACGYIMADPLLETCYRCGQDTISCAPHHLSSYFRTTALLAAPDSGKDDPFPLKVSEHTAQVSSREARNEERWFQDLFLDGQNEFDQRVDMLSVTTTMEMGIDIGSLLCVGLRNVPPTVANYQQRAGRAGRRGSALASVVTFASARNHDAYYFDRPPEIVSAPPRVPTLHFANPIIARRHVRSLVLQEFFATKAHSASNLFASWGSISDFNAGGYLKDFEVYLTEHLTRLRLRSAAIVAPELHHHLDEWMMHLPIELGQFAANAASETLVLDGLISQGYLPKYAFPIDVVSLTIPMADSAYDEDDDAEPADVLQRDLKIAIAEYAPGSEVVRQSNQVTWKYRSVGLNDPYNPHPSFEATDRVLECKSCRAVSLLGASEPAPAACSICLSADLQVREAIRPKGFTVDGALHDAGRTFYESTDGIESGGSTTPVRLHVGASAFASPGHEVHFEGRLVSDVRSGTLLVTNNGLQGDGFVLCPTCGRQIDTDDDPLHRRPADVPPHYGPKRGPRAGDICPARGPCTNQVILLHPFYSEVILLGIELPSHLDAPFTTPAGNSIWQSFGTLIANAATKVLQVDPGELRAGVRPVRRSENRVHGEIFLYDDVPGGAGYARRVRDNLSAILALALQLGNACPNATCESGCYQCILDYRNQALHARLDRPYGTDLLRYVTNKQNPVLDQQRLSRALGAVLDYAKGRCEIRSGFTTPMGEVPFVLVTGDSAFALWPIHPLSAIPSEADQTLILEGGNDAQLRLAVHNLFDLERRPLWVVNHLNSANI